MFSLDENMKACTKIFQDYDILGFISKCYDFLHLSSYECAWGILKKCCGIEVLWYLNFK